MQKATKTEDNEKKTPKTWQTVKVEVGKAHREGKDLTIGPIYYKV